MDYQDILQFRYLNEMPEGVSRGGVDHILDTVQDLKTAQKRFFERFLHYVECQIATEEDALGRKSTSKSDLRRLATITDAMISDMDIYAADESKQNGDLLQVRERWSRTKDWRQKRAEQ